MMSQKRKLLRIPLRHRNNRPMLEPRLPQIWDRIQNVESFPSKADTLLTDRPHTISSAYQHAHVRSGISTDTYNPPDFSDMVQARSMPASLNPQSTPSARIQQQQSSKVADRIYARPALVFNKEVNAAIAVATPTIPSHIVFAMDKSRKGSGSLNFLFASFDCSK